MTKRFTKAILTAVFAFLTGGNPASAATTVFDNLGNSVVGYGTTSNTQQFAFQFTSDSNYLIQDVTLSLSGNNPATIYLVNDLAGIPGLDILQTFSSETPNTGTATPITFSPTSIYALAAGVTYHIVLQSQNVESWITLDPANSGSGSTDFKIEINTESNWVQYDDIQILGKIQVTPVPEPGIPMFGMLTALAALRRRRK